MANVNIVMAPPTTTYTIAFLYNDLFRSFNTAFYSPAITEGRASSEEINQVLKEIITVNEPFLKKLKAYICCFALTTLLSSFGIIPFFIFVAPMNVVLIPISVALYFFLVVGSLFIFLKAVKRYNKDVRRVSQVVVDKANQEFNHRGLRWVLPKQFPKWVELWKDYQGQGGMTQPIYMFPMNQQLYANYDGAANQMAGQPQYQQNYYPGYQNNDGYVPLPQV